MAITLKYNIRNMILRKRLTLMTALGIALTVTTTVFLMMLLAGMKKAFVSSGDPLHVLVMRKGSTSELVGGFTKDKLPILRQLTGIATDSHGQPLVSGEWVVIVALPKRGTTADVLFSGIDIPPGILLWEDPPLHDLHRRLLSRVFTPRRMLAVEGLVRDLCSRALDPLRDLGGFDFVADLGAIMPMRTIGYLLGIPEEGQQQIRERNDKSITVESGGTLLSATTLEE